MSRFCKFIIRKREQLHSSETFRNKSRNRFLFFPLRRIVSFFSFLLFDNYRNIDGIPHNTPHSYSAKMTFTNDLSTPLLGNPSRRELELKLEHERDEQYAEDDEEVCMRGSKLIVHDSSHEEYENEQSSDKYQTNWWFDSCSLLSMFVSTLLSLQCSMTLNNSTVEATTVLSWSVVNYCIVLYVIIAALYRQSVIYCGISCPSTLLMPIILMNNMLFLVLFNEVVAAFLLLLVSMLCLAAFTVARKIRLFLVGPSAFTVDDTSDNKLAVSLFRREGLVPAKVL
jgi:hypothetical protein